jgi:LEA14-like dessication related protein
MRVKVPTLAALLGGAVALCATACGAGAPRLSARLESVSTDKVTTVAAELLAHVQASSPTGVGLAVSKAHVTVKSGDATVLDEDVDLDPVVDVTGPRTIDVPVRVPFAMLVSAVPDAWAKGEVPVTVGVVLRAGDLRGDAGARPAKITLLAGATATLDSVKFEGLTFGEPYLVVAIKVHNDNPAATVVVEEVTGSVNLDGTLLVKNGKGEEHPTLAPGEDGIVRLQAPLDYAAHPGLEKKIKAGYETVPFFADGKVIVSTASGRITSDFHVEGGMMLHR